MTILTCIKQLFHVKMSKIKMLKWMYGRFGHNYEVAALGQLLQA